MQNHVRISGLLQFLEYKASYSDCNQNLTILTRIHKELTFDSITWDPGDGEF